MQEKVIQEVKKYLPKVTYSTFSTVFGVSFEYLMLLHEGTQLPIKNLLMVLFILKLGSTFALTGSIFGVKESITRRLFYSSCKMIIERLNGFVSWNLIYKDITEKDKDTSITKECVYSFIIEEDGYEPRQTKYHIITNKAGWILSIIGQFHLSLFDIKMFLMPNVESFIEEQNAFGVGDNQFECDNEMIITPINEVNEEEEEPTIQKIKTWGILSQSLRGDSSLIYDLHYIIIQTCAILYQFGEIAKGWGHN